MEANISQFVTVTGASVDVARGLLEACSGNLDLAINMHLESRGGASSTPAVVGASGGPSGGARAVDDILSPKSYEELYGVRAPIPQTRGVLVEENTPPRRALRSRRLPQSVFDPFQDYSASSSWMLGNDAKKKQNLSELFKPPHDIMFHGSFREARLDGEHKQRWLLVNVQDSKEFASQVLNRDVWSNHNVKDIIREHFVFWQIHRITDDGVKFKQLYHFDSYPYIAVIDPRTGEKMANWNSLTASEFTKVIQDFLADHHYDDGDHQLSNLASRKSTVVELSEQSQLEAAIQESLRNCQTSSRKSSKYQLVFSDSDDDEVDTISLSSDSDVDEVDGACTSVELGSDTLTHTSAEPSTNDRFPMCTTSDVKMKPLDESGETQHEELRRNRKRTSSQSSAQDELPRKVLRSSAAQVNPHFVESQNISSRNGKHSVTLVSPAGQSEKRRNVLNGKRFEDSRDSSTSSTTVEQLLETGAIGKDKVSHILFRLPDGSRLQKVFICSHPIKELFDFLQDQGLNMSEHEAVTHFPRRNISVISPTVSFKDSGLYPRETVFVHSTE